ncbi:Hypothetical protein BQ3484_21, partial [Cedratvirus A11]
VSHVLYIKPLDFSLQDIDKIAHTINKEDLPQRIFDYLRLSRVGISTIYRTEIVLKKEKDGAMWSMSVIFHTPIMGKCTIRFKELNRQEKQLLVYGVKRGTQKTITITL